MKKKSPWIDVIIKVLNGEKNIASPFDAQGTIESFFVVVIKEERLGWGRIWCSATRRGIHLCRMVVPDNVHYFYDEEANAACNNLPEITLEDFT
ncbi:hypothetical protein [Chitinophaga caseinilytica]|uniref:Uncharacterized protein n=1 Tax=Chitinophaga caseinilytica TaxID=2267521 RepID=A0ABZ2YYA6_9BACT